MPKESESLNHKDNSNSKMIAIPPTPQVEEVLISDEEQPETDSQPYEARLNEKLRDLGLYEDGMTIQQKEELLAVVVASWQTAEEEKTRRQFYQDYVNASEAFCNDQIEFSFKESPECSNQASLYNATSQYFDIPLPPGSPSDSYSNDTGTKSLKPNGDLSQEQDDIASDSSLENCEDMNCTASPSELFIASHGKSKGRSPRRGRGKRGRGSMPKESSAGSSDAFSTQSTTNLKRVKDIQLINKQPKNESEEQCISLWKPCLSPKDIPLSCSKKPWLTEPEPSCNYTEEEYSTKVLDLIKDLDFARISNLQRFPPDRTLSKPYHLTRRGHFSKKSSKPDKTDIMVGVLSKKNTDGMEGITKFLDYKEPFSRTSSGAFRYVQANKTKSNLPGGNFEAQTTRSGLKYGLYSNQNSNDINSKETEVKDSYRTMDGTDDGDSKWPTSSEGRETPSNLYSEVEVILDENLPKFNNLRPGLYVEDFSFMDDVSDQVNSVHNFEGISETKNHSASESSERINHNASSSYVDNDSSDGSSVIDVETVVDDEVSRPVRTSHVIEEFVLKRKMLQDYQCTEKEPNPNQSKRLKKTAL